MVFSAFAFIKIVANILQQELNECINTNDSISGTFFFCCDTIREVCCCFSLRKLLASYVEAVGLSQGDYPLKKQEGVWESDFSETFKISKGSNSTLGNKLPPYFQVSVRLWQFVLYVVHVCKWGSRAHFSSIAKVFWNYLPVWNSFPDRACLVCIEIPGSMVTY